MHDETQTENQGLEGKKQRRRSRLQAGHGQGKTAPFPAWKSRKAHGSRAGRQRGRGGNQGGDGQR